LWFGKNTVVLIIGILAAVATPTFLAQREKAQIATCKSDTGNAAEAAVLYASENYANNTFQGLTLDQGPPDPVSEGFNQIDGYTTTVNVDANDPTIATLSTACQNGQSAEWTTTDGQFRGQVHLV
jgi:type II secretory pathway pseudopilin PulG